MFSGSSWVSLISIIDHIERVKIESNSFHRNNQNKRDQPVFHKCIFVSQEPVARVCELSLLIPKESTARSCPRKVLSTSTELEGIFHCHIMAVWSWDILIKKKKKKRQ